MNSENHILRGHAHCGDHANFRLKAVFAYFRCNFYTLNFPHFWPTSYFCFKLQSFFSTAQIEHVDSLLTAAFVIFVDVVPTWSIPGRTRPQWSSRISRRWRAKSEFFVCLVSLSNTHKIAKKSKICLLNPRAKTAMLDREEWLERV